MRGLASPPRYHLQEEGACAALIRLSRPDLAQKPLRATAAFAKLRRTSKAYANDRTGTDQDMTRLLDKVRKLFGDWYMRDTVAAYPLGATGTLGRRGGIVTRA